MSRALKNKWLPVWARYRKEDVMITIHVLGFGELYQHVLNAISAFMNQKGFFGLLKLTALIGIIMASVGYLKQRNPIVYAKWVLGYTLVVNLVILPKTDVGIYDIAAQKMIVVSHVPVVFAATASLITTVGVGLAESYDALMTMPDDLTYTKTGSLFGSKIIQASRDFRIIDPELKREMDGYLRNCVVGDIRLNHKYSVGDIGNSTDIWALISREASPLRMTRVNSQLVTCKEAANPEGPCSLRTKLNAEIKRAYSFFGINLFGHQARTSYEKFFETHLTSAFNYYQNMTDSSANIFLQSMMINEIGDGINNYQAFTDSTAGVVNNQVAKSKVQHRWSWEIAGQKAAWFLPLLHTLLTVLLFGIFPIILVMTTLPNGVNIFKGYLQFFVSLQFWPVLFAILNAVMTIYGRSQSGKYGAFTMVNIDKIDELHADLSGVAGYLMLMIPFLAKGFVSNLSEAFSGLATSMTGHLQGSAMAVANDAASASFSLGQTSFYNTSANNMSVDNTSSRNISTNNTSANNVSANKHDTNWTDFHGMRTVQMENGATLSETQSGHRSVNVGPAMSQLAVNLHGSDRVSDAMHQGATNSFSHANQLRTAGDSHLQAAKNLMKHFTNTDSNDYRSGEGTSLTATDSVGQDLRIMQDSVKQWNEHHDKSGHVSVEGAATIRANSNHSFPGKIFGIVTGVSGEVSGSTRTGGQRSQSHQKFLNSSEGKSFADAYHHMVSQATNNHLDATDAKNLSTSEQIAANFAASHSLLQQSASEYSHGMQLQKAANHVKEHATGIDTNLNQPFHDWVCQEFGAEGERVLTQTDMGSIQQQERWADAFFNSSVGQDAISREVQGALHASPSSLKADYKRETDAIKKQSILNDFTRYQHEVDNASHDKGAILMDEHVLNQAKSSLEQHRMRDMTPKTHEIKENVSNNIEIEKSGIQTAAALLKKKNGEKIE